MANATESGPRLQVVVVDDDPIIGEELVDFLTRSCFVATYVEDAEFALAVIERKRPPVVVLDIQMPMLSGPRMSQILRDIGFRGTIIFITGDLEAFAIARGDFNAVWALKKPVDLDQLRMIIATGLGVG